jgi:glycosyltransferase involved in cell wall biosynthesis
MARVVRIIARLNVGGPAIHAVLASSGMGADYPTLLVTGHCGPAEGDMAYLAAEHGVEPVVIPELGRAVSPFDDLRAFVKLVALLRRERPDIVHTHTAKAGTLGRLAAILCGVPVRVHTFHGHVFAGYFPPWQTQLFLAVERLLGRFTHRIVTLSDGLRRELVERYHIAPWDTVAVIPLGLDLQPMAACAARRGELRRELGVGKSARLVGIVGRLVPIKNHDLFLDAFAALPRRGARAVHGVVVGGGELEARLRQRVRALGLADRVHFLGWRRDLAPVYADLDVAVLTSRNEGTPVALIEAMAAGVPVVATAVGGAPDLLDHGEQGELVPPPFRAADLAAAIGRALTPAARARSARLAPGILEAYSAARLCRDLESLYNALVPTSAPRGDGEMERPARWFSGRSWSRSQSRRP